MRVEWPERWDRPGWDVGYSTIGGRLQDDPLEVLPEDLREPCGRALSQVFLAATPGDTEPDPDVAYWASVAKKVIQRGERPVLMHHDMRQLSVAPPEIDHILAAVAGPATPIDLDASLELHETFEQPLWDWMETETPLSRWLVPQAPLEALAGEADATTSRWVDWLAYFPWDRRAAVIEVDGSGHERRPGVDRDRDQLLTAAGIAVERIPGPEVVAATSPVMRRLAVAAPPWLGLNHPELERALHLPAAIHRFAFGLVEAVVRGFLQPAKPWNIEVRSDVAGIEDVANVALDLLLAIADSWNLRIVPKELVINGTTWSRTEDRRYARTDRMSSDSPDVLIRLEAFVPPHAALDSVQAPTVVVRGALLPQDLAWTSPPIVERRNRASPRSQRRRSTGSSKMSMIRLVP